MLTFEKVLEIFKDYLALDTELEVCKSRYGYIRVEFNEIGDILDYCSGVVCRTPEELFDVLLDDRILWLRQNIPQRITIQGIQISQNRQTADYFGNQTE